MRPVISDGDSHGDASGSWLLMSNMFLAGRSDSQYLQAPDFVDNERLLSIMLRPHEKFSATPRMEMSEWGVSSIRLGMEELTKGVGYSIFHRRGHANFQAFAGCVLNCFEASIQSVMDGTRFGGPESKVFSGMMSKQERVLRMRMAQVLNAGQKNIFKVADDQDVSPGRMVKAGSVPDDGLRRLGQFQEQFATTPKSLPRKLKAASQNNFLALHHSCPVRALAPDTVYKALNNKVIPRFGDDSYDRALEAEFITNIRRLLDDMDLAKNMFPANDQSGKKLFEGGARFKTFLKSGIAKTLRLQEKHDDSVGKNVNQSWAKLAEGATPGTETFGSAFGGLQDLFGIQNLVAPQIESAKVYLSLSAILSVLTNPVHYAEMLMIQSATDRVRNPRDPTAQMITPFKFFCDHVIQRMMDNIRLTKYQGKHFMDLLLSIPYQFDVDIAKLKEAYSDSNWRAKQDYTFKKQADEEIVPWTLHKTKYRKYLKLLPEQKRGAIFARERALK